jgi:hypothetical protein
MDNLILYIDGRQVDRRGRPAVHYTLNHLTFMVIPFPVRQCLLNPLLKWYHPSEPDRPKVVRWPFVYEISLVYASLSLRNRLIQITILHPHKER